MKDREQRTSHDLNSFWDPVSHTFACKLQLGVCNRLQGRLCYRNHDDLRLVFPLIWVPASCPCLRLRGLELRSLSLCDTRKPVSNVTKATKPALKPEASQAQATVSQCQCECEGCLIGNCPKEIKKLGLIPEVSPGCICKAVIYQTCFVPSTCAVKFHECFCNSLNMFQDGMCTCHDMFLSNLSRAQSNLMLCLTCLACWLSRVVLVVLLEVLEAWLGRIMLGLSCLVEKVEIRHLVLKPRLAL